MKRIIRAFIPVIGTLIIVIFSCVTCQSFYVYNPHSEEYTTLGRYILFKAARTILIQRDSSLKGLEEEVERSVDYIEQTMQISNEYAKATEIIANQLEAIERDPSLFEETTWFKKLALGMTMIERNNRKLRNMTPPAQLKAVHREWLTAAQHFDNALDVLGDWLRGGGLGELDEYVEEIHRASEAIERAEEELQSLLDLPDE